MSNPRSLAEFFDLLPLAPGCVWREVRNDELAGLGSGAALTFELADPLWGMSVVLDWSEWPEARRLAAMTRSLTKPGQDFLMTNPIGQYPAYDPGGTILGASSVTILAVDPGTRRVSFAGLPAGYQLTWGDFGEVVFGAAPQRRYVFELHGTATANGFHETGLVEISPPIWPGIVAGATVNLKRPATRAFIVPGSLREGPIRTGIVDGMSFTALQRR